MKNIKSLGLVVLLSCLSLSAQAKPVVTVADVYAQPNSTTYFTVNLTIDEDKKDTYLAFGCDIDLPTGFTPDNESHIMLPAWTGSSASVGSRIVANAPYAIPGTEVNGLFSIALKVGNVDPGDYTVSLTTIYLEYPPKEADYTENDVTFTIHVSNVLTLDENSQVAPELTEGDATVRVLRTLNKGEWSTICFPFYMSEDDVNKIFGEGTQLAEFDKNTYSSADDQMTVEFIAAEPEGTDLLLPNKPYIIKTTKDVSEFTFDTFLEPIPDATPKVEYKVGRTVKGTFYANYKARTVIPEKGVFISGNKFWYSVGLTKIKAFRGYFMFSDLISDYSAASSRIKFAFTDDEGTTQIQIPELLNDGEYYDLNGLRVDTPSKGIYIKDGKKVVVK